MQSRFSSHLSLPDGADAASVALPFATIVVAMLPAVVDQFARWSWDYRLIVLLLIAATRDMVFEPGV